MLLGCKRAGDVVWDVREGEMLLGCERGEMLFGMLEMGRCC
jgi:hypothetical protein